MGEEAQKDARSIIVSSPARVVWSILLSYRDDFKPRIN
jgi:hypothetical protein